MKNGQISHWMTQENTSAANGEARTTVVLDADTEADVCIVGAGLSGLWLAYHLTEQRPDTKVVIIEKQSIGFGASGRNAGWLSPLVPGNRRAFSKTAGSRSSGVELQRRMLDAVDEVLEILRRHGIDAQAKRSGNVVVARNRAAMARLTDRRRTDLDWGLRSDEVVVLDAGEVAGRINVDGAVGGLFYPTVARLNPAALVTGLAALVESRGVQIFEHSPAVDIAQGKVTTPNGVVHATSVLRCTEAYTSNISADPRRLIPLNSSIVITEPLTDAAWREIGWQNYECFSDAAHLFSYGQRTDDGRILIGGRGSPYRFGSDTGGSGEVDAATVRALTHRLHQFFPSARDTPIAHTWSGVIGVTRDWCASVDYDEPSGVGHAQGYAGHGVTSAYLATRTLADVIHRDDTTDAHLPWIGRQTRNWEPEPIRWLGIHGMYRMFELADRIEERTNASKTSILARVGSRLAGLHD